MDFTHCLDRFYVFEKYCIFFERVVETRKRYIDCGMFIGDREPTYKHGATGRKLTQYRYMYSVKMDSEMKW